MDLDFSAGCTVEAWVYPRAAVGWALGVERIVLLMQELGCDAPADAPHVYVVLVGETAARTGLQVAEQLRDALPGVRIETDLGGGGFKGQFKRADRSGAPLAVVIGDDEAAKGVAGLKSLRGTGAQETCPLNELPARIALALADGRT